MWYIALRPPCLKFALRESRRLFCHNSTRAAPSAPSTGIVHGEGNGRSDVRKLTQLGPPVGSGDGAHHRLELGDSNRRGRLLGQAARMVHRQSATKGWTKAVHAQSQRRGRACDRSRGMLGAHREKEYVQPVIQSENVGFIEIVTRSPDTNPIEENFQHADEKKLKRDAKKRPKDVDESCKRFKEEFQRLADTGVLANTVASMPRRMRDILDADGGPTKW